MNALTKSLEDRAAFVSSARDLAYEMKAKGSLALDLSNDPGFNALTDWQSASKYKQRYSLFHGVVYAAINALATEGASQPITVLQQRGVKKELRATKNLSSKAAAIEFETILDHPLVDCLRQPNTIQNKWQFMYCFLVNLCLTGWGYVVGGETDDGKIEMYAIPTTWITPDHTKGPFAKFKLRNPSKPEQKAESLDGKNVAFAYLPDPSDLLSAIAPASAQLPAIKSNDNIWQSRLQFFKNGIFPGAVVTVGSNPHPSVPAGVRPRLTGNQRRQVHTMIKKLMGGIANYGNPAILDGIIEKIDKLSMDSREMGWEKSEPSTKAAILSSFCVHPYVLGEHVGVGGYAQVANIEKRFYKRINTYLSMLDGVLTEFSFQFTNDKSLKVETEPCVSVDPQLDWSNFKYGRDKGDVSQNELREKLGLPPDEDDNQSAISPQLMTPIVQLLAQKANGAVDSVQVESILVGIGLPDDLAKKIAGKDLPPPPPPVAPPPVPPEAIAAEKPPEAVSQPAAGKPGSKPPKGQQALNEAVKELRNVPEVEMSRLESLFKEV